MLFNEKDVKIIDFSLSEPVVIESNNKSDYVYKGIPYL